MTAEQKKHMRAYLVQHHGTHIIGKECDVCYVDKVDKTHYELLEYLTRSDTGEFSHTLPNLCPDHGRELGLVW